ncbi:MAG: hypothetical protein CMF25_06575 [Kangiellaceae bacterium]|nr:hypothetical protein [Kangiellaceae bacterium]|tara:strand:+ start:171 stop:1376 length:1206 start_codon:yes stop_codon:yes gene_type:complete
MRRLISTFALICSIPAATFAGEWYHQPSISLSAAQRLHGEDQLTSQVNALGLLLEFQGSTLSAKFQGRVEYDSAYDWHDGYSDAAKDEYQSRLWVDDAYLRWFAGSVDLSLGYQKVVWGQADDLRVVDVVNPLDLKDFVLFDIDDYRMSLPMLRAETSFGNWSLDGMWILDAKANELPASGSEFDLGLPSDMSTNEPSGTEVGVRLQGFVADTDVAFYGFHGYNDMPVISFDLTGVSEDFHRESMLGTSLSRPFGPVVMRGEWAFFHQREFGYIDGSHSAHHQQQWLVGVDYLMGNWLITGQYSDRRIAGWNDMLATPEKDPLYTLSADGQLASDTIALRIAVSHSDSLGGGQLYQSKLTYRPSANWAWQLNIDLLDGEETNFFGQFQDNDRIWTSVTYTF